MTVVDYGCGIGSHTVAAAQQVGSGGRVYAVDNQEVAIETTIRRVQRQGLTNVTVLKANELPSQLQSNCVDTIHALDMIHMVPNKTVMLKDLAAMSRPGGRLIVDVAHARATTVRRCIAESKCWHVTNVDSKLIHCRRVDP